MGELRACFLRALVLFAPVGGLGFLVMTLFKESSGKLAVILVLPLLLLKSVGTSLPDAFFWPAFWVLQFLYVFLLVCLYRMVLRRL